MQLQRFADTFVFYEPIVNKCGDLSVLGLERIIGACCWAMIMLLGDKVPIRGAITIGSGAELEDRHFYGPALEKAYNIEREIADYPRIVVSEEVCQFLDKTPQFSSNPEIDQITKRLAKKISRSLISQDIDGQFIVDYLGDGVKELLPNNSQLISAINKAYEFVNLEFKRFECIKDKKHEERYRLLKEYMERRIVLWK